MPADQPAWVQTRRELLGARIREAREHANLSQVELRQHVGVDHKTIHRIEHGTSDPKFGVLLQIARAVGTSVADLVR